MTGEELFINSILIVMLFFLIKFSASDDERRLREEERREEEERIRRERIRNSDYRWGGDAVDEMAENATWQTGSGVDYYNKMEAWDKSFGNAFAAGSRRSRGGR